LDLDVHPQQRRRGLGAKLIAAARAYAETQKLGSIEVNWLSEDAQASAFWLSQGFDNFWYVDAIACPETASTAQNVPAAYLQSKSKVESNALHNILSNAAQKKARTSAGFLQMMIRPQSARHRHQAGITASCCRVDA
jgi:hypothetical protein